MKYLFAAGGTGGHINPALAVAGEIRERHPDSEILFIGTADKMEATLVPKAGFDFETIKISGFQRKPTPENIIRNIKTIIYLFISLFQTRKIIKKFDPDVVIGFGGYVSGPVLRTAYKLGYKTAIHEQNAYPGVTNKTLAKHVDRVMISVESVRDRFDSKNECIFTGLPVRGEMLKADRDFARAEMGIKDNEKLVLSMGGSLGAEAINKAMVDVICAKADDKNVRFIHSMGKFGLWVPDEIEKRGVSLSEHKNIEIREYISDMDRCMSAADVIVCRAGASSLSEIEALRKASILIPSPNVSENHQFHNAMALVNNNAAVIIEEKELSGEKLTKALSELLSDDDKRRKIGENAYKMAVIDSKEKIADIVDELASLKA